MLEDLPPLPYSGHLACRRSHWCFTLSLQATWALHTTCRYYCCITAPPIFFQFGNEGLCLQYAKYGLIAFTQHPASHKRVHIGCLLRNTASEYSHWGGSARMRLPDTTMKGVSGWQALWWSDRRQQQKQIEMLPVTWGCRGHPSANGRQASLHWGGHR